MAGNGGSKEKVTLSLPIELIRYADARARALATNRSRVMAEALNALREREQDTVAREGYGFYAEESEVFAAQSAAAVSESLNHAG